MNRLIETIDQYLAVDHLSLGPAALAGYLQDVRAALFDARSELTLMEARLELARIEKSATGSVSAPVEMEEPPEQCVEPLAPREPNLRPLPAAVPSVANLDTALDLRREFKEFMVGRKRGCGPKYEAFWVRAFQMTEKNGRWSVDRAAAVLDHSQSSGAWLLHRKYRDRMKKHRR
jgi:hypothetical protein